MPTSAPTKPPSVQPREQITAEGVFAELAVVKPILAAHQQTLASKLIPPLAERAKNIISGLKTDIRSQQTLEQVSNEVASETAREVFENLGKIQDKAQIPQVLADSLTSSIVTHPNVNPDLDVVTDTKKPPASADEEKIYEKAAKQVSSITKGYDSDLQKAAVLKNLSNLSSLGRDAASRQVVSTQVSTYIHENNLPDPQGTGELLQRDLARFVVTYGQNLARNVYQITSLRNPTLEDLGKVKTQAYDQSVAAVKSRTGQTPGTQDFEPVAQNVSTLLSLKPANTDTLNKMGLGQASPKLLTFARNGGSLADRSIGLAVATNQNAQSESFLSILAQHPAVLDTKEEKEIEVLKRKKSRSYQETKQLLRLQKVRKVKILAQSYNQKQRVKASGYVSTFLRAPRLARLDWVNESWRTVETSLSNENPGVFVPLVPARRIASIMPARFFGGQAARLGNFAKGAQSAVKVGELAGGFAAPALIIGASVGMLKNIAKTVGGYLFGLMLYALYLGKAALAGAMIGATVGGAIGFGAGAFVGFQLALLCGPLAVACGLATVPTFAFAGGLIGGAIGATAGTLIGYGLASGSTTAVSMGVGAGVGGTSGAIGGYMLGQTIAVGLDAIAVALCSTGVGCLIGAPLAVFGHVVLPPLLAATGAFLGTIAGAYIGYLVGHWVIPAFRGFFDGVASAFGATGTGIGSAFGAVGSFFTGLGSTMWGGLVSAGGGIFSGLSSIGSALFGGLGSGSTVGLAALSVGGAFTIPAAITIFVGIPIAATFFNPDPTGTQLVGGDNEFFTVTKSASRSDLENTDLPTTITFTITLEAKDTPLSAISVTDQISVTGRRSVFQETPDISPECTTPPNTLAAETTWVCHFNYTIPAETRFGDSLLINTVTISATPEGASQIQDSAIASVTVGNPPSNCPSGWPLPHGNMTQGPRGFTSHDELYPSEQAIDIGDNPRGTSTFATFTGTVEVAHTEDDNGYGVYVDISGTCDGHPFIARWAHLNGIDPAIRVGAGANVGQRVGSIDNTGHSDGDHLHYSFFGLEMREHYIPTNPTAINCDDSDPAGNTCDVNW